MSKFIFYYDEMHKVMPDLGTVSSDLRRIADRISSMDIPSFEHYNYLRNLKSDFETKSINIENLLEHINQANHVVDEFIDGYTLKAKALLNYKIEKRDSIIRL